MKKNIIGNILAVVGMVASIVTLQYRWVFLGILACLIGLGINLWQDTPGTDTYYVDETPKINEFSDHFIYYNLFDEHKGGK